MKISHDKKADTGNDDTDELNLVIRGNAASKIVGDFLVEDGNGGTGYKDKYASKKPSKAKIPIHELIIHLIF